MRFIHKAKRFKVLLEAAVQVFDHLRRGVYANSQIRSSRTSSNFRSSLSTVRHFASFLYEFINIASATSQCCRKCIMLQNKT